MAPGWSVPFTVGVQPPLDHAGYLHGIAKIAILDDEHVIIVIRGVHEYGATEGAGVGYRGAANVGLRTDLDTRAERRLPDIELMIGVAVQPHPCRQVGHRNVRNGGAEQLRPAKHRMQGDEAAVAPAEDGDA